MRKAMMDCFFCKQNAFFDVWLFFTAHCSHARRRDTERERERKQETEKHHMQQQWSEWERAREEEEERARERAKVREREREKERERDVRELDASLAGIDVFRHALASLAARHRDRARTHDTPSLGTLSYGRGREIDKARVRKDEGVVTVAKARGMGRGGEEKDSRLLGHTRGAGHAGWEAVEGGGIQSVVQMHMMKEVEGLASATGQDVKGLKRVHFMGAESLEAGKGGGERKEGDEGGKASNPFSDWDTLF